MIIFPTVIATIMLMMFIGFFFNESENKRTKAAFFVGGCVSAIFTICVYSIIRML
jgi:hypothetical protein